MNEQDIIPKDHYIKATLKGGQSSFNPPFIYKLGINVHPKPDRKSESACGEGLHLAKSFKAAKEYCKQAKEFYLAQAGVILGEDNDKVRCASVNIIRRLSDSEIYALDNKDIPVEWHIPDPPLCGWEWLKSNWHNITPSDINNQTLEISVPHHTMKLKAVLNRKDIKSYLSAITA